MVDGRKTRGKIGQKSEKAKLDKEWNQVGYLPFFLSASTVTFKLFTGSRGVFFDYEYLREFEAKIERLER